jgi:hypothetical protein
MYSDERERIAQRDAELKEWESDITGLKTKFGSFMGAEPPPDLRPAAPPPRGSAVRPAPRAKGAGQQGGATHIWTGPGNLKPAGQQ